MFGTFCGVHKAAQSAALCASGASGGAVMNADFDHHCMEFASSGGVYWANIGLNDLLKLVVWGFEGVDDISKDAGACQKSPGVGVDDE